jgi:hypothetical protein
VVYETQKMLGGRLDGCVVGPGSSLAQG